MDTIEPPAAGDFAGLWSALDQPCNPVVNNGVLVSEPGCTPQGMYRRLSVSRWLTAARRTVAIAMIRG